MYNAFSLPILPQAYLDTPSLRVHRSPAPERPGLPRVVRVPRRGPLLQAGPLGADGEVLSLNLAQGCAHRCAFCSARAYPSYPGDDVVYLYADSADRLATELASRRRKPRAVYLSPSTDPFMPFAEVQNETCRVVEVLAEQGVEAWLMTRGYIRPAALETLAAHKEHVKVTVGVTTLDRSWQRALEPLAAPPKLRLRQIGHLRERGVRVHVELTPLLPGLTDTRENLQPLLEALATVGVRHVTAGYLFLRSGIQSNLEQVLESKGWRAQVLDQFAGGPMLRTDGTAAARYLPRARRQRGYAALKALAANVGISVSVCQLTNPDFLAAPAAVSGPSHRLREAAAAWGR